MRMVCGVLLLNHFYLSPLGWFDPTDLPKLSRLTRMRRARLSGVLLLVSAWSHGAAHDQMSLATAGAAMLPAAPVDGAQAAAAAVTRSDHSGATTTATLSRRARRLRHHSRGRSWRQLLHRGRGDGSQLAAVSAGGAVSMLNESAGARGWGAAFSGYLLHFEAGDLHRLPASDTRRTGPRDDPRNVNLYAKSSEPPTGQIGPASAYSVVQQEQQSLQNVTPTEDVTLTRTKTKQPGGDRAGTDAAPLLASFATFVAFYAFVQVAKRAIVSPDFKPDGSAWARLVQAVVGESHNGIPVVMSSRASSSAASAAKQRAAAAAAAAADGGSVESEPSSVVATRLAVCVVGVMVSHLLWGVLQERIFTQPYESGAMFDQTNFLVFANRSFAVVLTWLARSMFAPGDCSAPLYVYSYGAYTNIVSSMSQYEMLKYISFPMQVLAKSCKMPPVMLMSFVVSRKRYPCFEWAIAALVVVGASLFQFYAADDLANANIAEDTQFVGVLLILIYVTSDSFTSTWQAEIFATHGVDIFSMMLFTNLFACAFTFIGLVVTAEFVEVWNFMHANPSVILDVCTISASSSVGQLFILYTIKHFGPVTFAAIATVRQLLSILISIAWFEHTITPMQVLGVAVVFAALGTQVGVRWHRKMVRDAEAPPTLASPTPAKTAAVTPPTPPGAKGGELVGGAGVVGFRAWGPTACSIGLLMSVAATKTILTKLIFQQVSIPVAFSLLSCVMTILLLLPVFAVQPHLFQWVRPHMVKQLSVVCVMVAVDLGFTNIAISMLPLALQQCIAATTPAATVSIESVYERRLQHPAIYGVIVALCAGAVVAELGAFSGPESARDLSGEIMMLMAVFAAACKYVFAKATVEQYRDELGPLAFLFWVEVIILLILLPWALANGEIARLFAYADSVSIWVPLCCCSALGGVRFFAELLILRSASATSLSTANLATHATVMFLSIPLFGTTVTPFLIIGCTLTLSASAVYTYLKLSGMLVRKEQQPLLTPEERADADADDAERDARDGT